MRTRLEIEKASHVFQGDERWLRWMACGVHPLAALPLTDTGESYCEQCCTLWTPAGAMLNMPEPRCHGCGKPFTSSDQRESSFTNTPNGKQVVEPHWHKACWDAHVAEKATGH